MKMHMFDGKSITITNLKLHDWRRIRANIVMYNTTRGGETGTLHLGGHDSRL